MNLRHRGVFQNILRVVRHEPIQFLLLFIDTFQHRSGSEKFERAAHRKTFLGPTIEMLAASCIQRGNPDSTASSRLDGSHPIFEFTLRNGCARRSKQQNENSYHR